MELDQFSWIVHASAATLLIVVVAKALHLDLVAILKILLSEFRSIMTRPQSLGAVNGLSIILTFVFGCLVLGAVEIKLFLRVILSSLPEKSAALVPSSFTLEMMFLCLVVIALFSIAAVFLNERGDGS